MPYQHTQFGWPILALLSWILSFVLLALYILGPSVPVYLFAGAVVLVAFLFHKLTIVVTDTSVKWGFGLGVFGKDIAFTEIESVHSVTNSWQHGLGIKITHDGWVYGVSGFSAIALVLKDGTQIRIGTNDQARLLSVLMQFLPQTSSVQSDEK
ncbi:hypothetical protein PULV_a1293 [Pseudoalteromonas ulvae UL12]|uniref:Bacterial Pleckstrin homology domain-containing protein n=1 Tax=Pseudoalteromonas ulvae TaxID=107327 RepID=A0A244CTT2_PSEDV|nr:hypothetical protein [Pseudoalteromonas ulvae]MBE0363801.1 hypothetical protein [Pseudoalteromonas ulvae UL12]OUL58639.1 hypothetical protein B1199_10005 [Pseudoalteromonas ulvae]